MGDREPVPRHPPGSSLVVSLGVGLETSRLHTDMLSLATPSARGGVRASVQVEGETNGVATRRRGWHVSELCRAVGARVGSGCVPL
eukprot:169664-Amphidinium_carterae.1